MRVPRRVLLAITLLASPICGAQPSPTPSFAELEAQGAVIGVVRIDTRDIFDLDDPKENNAFFRFANRMHATTRPSVIARDVLFKPGDRVSVKIIDETERLLRSNPYLHEVQILPVNYRDGVVDHRGNHARHLVDRPGSE